MALAVLLSQVVLPAQPAFAAGHGNNGSLKVHEIGTEVGTESNDPKVCAFNFEGFGFDNRQEGYVMLETQGGSTPVGTNSGPYSVGPAERSGYFVSQNFNTAGAVQIPNGTYKATMYGKGGQATNQNEKAKSKVFKVDCQPALTSATAVNGSFADICGPSFNATFTAAQTTGVTYTPLVNGNTITVTATANEGYVLSNPGFSQTYTDLLAACPPSAVPATAVNGLFVDVCGDAFNLSFTAATSNGVTYVPVTTGNTIAVTAVAKPGFYLTNPDWAQSQTDTLTSCPTIKACTTNSTSIVSKYEDFADYNDTRATGHTEFTANGLRIWTEGTTSTDKVAWYNLVTPYAFSEIGTPAIDYDNTTSGGVPGMQILFDKNGDGSIDAILVGETNYQGRWWSNTAGLGVSSQDGYPSSATLEEYLVANPLSKVNGVGFSLGSGVKGDGLLKSITFGCQTWEFKKVPRVPTQCTVKNNLFIQPWSYDDEMYPATGGTAPGTYKFMADGLHLSTPAQDSYVYGQMSAGNTPIVDIDDMSYVTYRDVTSMGDPQVVTAYILYVDLDGNLATDDGTYLFYEPTYNGTVQTGTWQTWDVDADAAKFWSFDLSGGNPSLTWAGIVASYPNAVAVSYGFNQGTYNQGTNSRIQNMVFDCGTTTFGVPGSGGAGEEDDEPVVPVTPTTPTLPVTPAALATPVKAADGQGAFTPSELPLTGSNGSIVSTWVALLAAILTYGAVLYLQPKKRFEQ